MGLKTYPGQTMTQVGRLQLYHRSDLGARDLVEAIKGGGDILKVSPKSEIRRVGEWVVKRSRLERGLGPIKRTLARGRYRRAWVAANYLHVRGVCVPEPLAYGEWSWRGLMWGNVMATEFLDGYMNVEQHAAQMVRGGASQQSLDSFFTDLAFDVNRLVASGAYHADLSGKNIFTKDGHEFCFIDLDGVVVGRHYTDSLRLKNHVQLYDSFCDFCSHDMLMRFIQKMAPQDSPFSVWLQAVEHGQKMRRRLHYERNR